jgi:U3 small nucleolar RNA-associated protein 18
MASSNKKSRSKPKEEEAEPLPEEEMLTEALFGKAEDKVLAADNQGWMIDTAPSAGKASAAGGQAKARKRTAAAWVDDDDVGPVSLTATNRTRKLRASAAPEDNTVSGEAFEEKLRARFLASQATQQQEWAKLPTKSKVRRREGEDSDDADDSNAEGGSGSDEEGYGAAVAAALRSTAPLKRGAGVGPLPAGELDVLRCKDANAAGPSRAVVRSCAFHPRGELLLTAGLDKSLRFFAVDGARNPLLETCFLKDLPAYQAQWTNGGEQVVVSGRRPFFYVYDAHSGAATKV